MSTAQKPQSMTQTFWIGIGLLLFSNRKALLHVAPLTSLAALLIGAACMYPVYLWCAGRVRGMPVFPFFSLTYLWTFSLPLLSNNPNVLKYSPEQHLYAGVTAAIFLICGTVVWIQLVKSPGVTKPYRALKAETAETFFIAIVGAGALLNMYVIGGWTGIPDKLFTIVRGIILGLSFLGIFVLAYRCGEGSLPRSKARIFVTFLALNIISAAASLILKTALTLFLLSVIAFVIGGRKLPLIAVMIGLVALLPLHYGKHEMRHKYWSGNSSHYVQPWEYPVWFQEWSGYAVENLNPKPNRYEPKKEKKESFIERSSVIHMLMMAQEKIPAQYTYVGGATYAIIPLLFVPRALLPNKIRSHEGTHMLNIHIHRQTYQDTLKTTIAWGLLPEAYANFGLVGCAAIGAILGAFYGAVTRLAIGTPAFSARTMFCVLVLSLALASTEWTAGVYAATLFQSSVPILGIRTAFMKLQRPSPEKLLPSRQ
jgi:hypothetical protein